MPVTANHIADIIKLIDENKLNFSIASQQLFPAICENAEKTAEETAKELNLLQDNDTAALEEMIDAALAKFPDKVAEYRGGKTGILGLFMGEVMKLSKGKADPKMTSKMLEHKLTIDN